jgi:GrpB-like predicted nucleotidyltransferase (UPF0157 family)
VDIVRFKLSQAFQPAAAEIVQRVAIRVRSEVSDADVQDMGATAVPGLLTKGDVDVSVRVPERDFVRAVELLRSHFEVHQPHNWTDGYASFVDDRSYSLPVGVQVTVKGHREDKFLAQRDRLLARPDLLAAYNDLKCRYEGADMDEYRAAKQAFIAEHLEGA